MVCGVETWQALIRACSPADLVSSARRPSAGSGVISSCRVRRRLLEQVPERMCDPPAGHQDARGGR
eukprot:CAMPEP_0170189036 /NCGR_PEP_ID=MMETSP0040_2-20121228/45853_1 /TAXON_ID=641309 /ORGANISM="Lotharella oceanica, Strain CCMP622" /LENGTH=65 /DNA_ID=CAMNT_0010436491 /DNA_START=1144 /DNA_END=1341 /DNA_ORIENTATION=-